MLNWYRRRLTDQTGADTPDAEAEAANVTALIETFRRSWTSGRWAMVVANLFPSTMLLLGPATTEVSHGRAPQSHTLVEALRIVGNLVIAGGICSWSVHFTARFRSRRCAAQLAASGHPLSVGPLAVALAGTPRSEHFVQPSGKAVDPIVSKPKLRAQLLRRMSELLPMVSRDIAGALSDDHLNALVVLTQIENPEEHLQFILETLRLSTASRTPASCTPSRAWRRRCRFRPTSSRSATSHASRYPTCAASRAATPTPRASSGPPPTRPIRQQPLFAPRSRAAAIR